MPAPQFTGPAVLPPELANQARALLAAGRYGELAEYARGLAARFPDSGFVWMVLGIALDRLGHRDAALSAMQNAVRCSPGDAGTHYTLANLHKDQGRLEDAVTAYRRALSLKSDLAEAHTNLGYALRQLGRLEDAATSLRQALEIRPDMALAHNLLGLTLRDQGKLAEAIASLQAAIGLGADFAEAHFNLGLVFQDLADRPNALRCFHQALACQPDYVDALLSLGIALKEGGEPAEAIRYLRDVLRIDARHVHALNELGLAYVATGQFLEAAATFERALGLAPDLAETHNNLGTLAARQGRYAEAEANYRRALELAPDMTEGYCNLGIAQAGQGRLFDAEDAYRRSLALRPGHDAAHNLGVVLKDQGRHGEAVENFRTALSFDADSIETYDSLLFTLNYDPDRSGEEIFAAYREFDERFGVPLRTSWRAHGNDRNPARRLRIGYVSADFCRHVVRHFLEPLLAHHDKGAVEVFAYAEVRREDDVTARFRTYADHWLSTLGLSDEALAERIRADGIDVLVDLAGHTAGNRLLVFARKPAPVSVSWLGYGYTTGLSAIDYLLTDEASCPPGSEHLFAETPWRLATPGYAYRAPEGMGEVSPLPALQRGQVTFGTLTRGVRINHRTIRVWAEILKRLPTARLVIDSGHFKEGTAQAALAARFAAHGIGAERLAIGCHSPPWDVLRGMDIGLDCFPHNSGTTLFESLYMGVPFVTLAGRPSVGRLGSSILHGVGHPEWIAGPRRTTSRRRWRWPPTCRSWPASGPACGRRCKPAP